MFEHSVGELVVAQKNLNVTPAFFIQGEKTQALSVAAIRKSEMNFCCWLFSKKNLVGNIFL